MFTSLFTLFALVAQAQTYSHAKSPVQPVSLFGINSSAFGDVVVAQKHNEVNMMFPYGFDAHIATLTFTGGASTTSVNGAFTVQTAASANSSALMCSRAALRYMPGVGGYCIHTADWTQGVAASTQIAGCFSRDLRDGYGFGFNGTTFGILRSSGGFNTWIPQSEWNVDKMDGAGPSKQTLVHTKGSIFAEQYQWLGYGTINFYIESLGSTGNLVKVHEIRYAGTQDMTSVQNPSLNLCVYAKNHENASQIRISAPSHSGFSEGLPGNGSPKHSTATVQVSVGATPYPILTIRSTETYKGQSNRVGVGILSISLSNESTNRSAEFRLHKNATSITGASFFRLLFDENSVIDVDESGTAIAGGDISEVFFVGPGDALNIPMSTMGLTLEPGESLSVVGKMDSGTADLKAALSWQEEF